MNNAKLFKYKRNVTFKYKQIALKSNPQRFSKLLHYEKLFKYKQSLERKSWC